ncbi:MAG: Ltp family lipoprotein [Gordonibacter sp.]|uniref:Ltp family lipoprotein n=1 Tax=Gordonibacter sp. TaxID=1968902 RepID=UPI002FC64B29
METTENNNIEEQLSTLEDSSTMTQPSSTAGAVGIKQRFPIWAKVVIACVSIICVAFIAVLGLGTWAMSNGYGQTDNAKGEQQAQVVVALDETIQVGSVSMRYPSSWEVVTNNDQGFQIISEDGAASVFIQKIEKKNPDKKWFNEFAKGVSETSSNIRDYSLDGCLGKRFNCSMDVNGIAYDSDCVVVATKNEVVACIVGAKDTLYDNVLSDIAASLRVVESDVEKKHESTAPKTEITPPKVETPAPKVETPAPAAPAETAGQKNAVKKAKSYINVSAFSYSGLIEQLEYSKFSTEDATYGADNCGANWMTQAEKKAASYLEVSSFSRDGLIEQLVYSGFTEEQAVHGADSVGL